MKTIAIIMLCCFSACIFTSCEKVIDVKLNDSAKKYVIEGVITDQPGSCKVSITQTKNFNEDNTFAGITGANVTITDEAGAVQTLADSGGGIYKSSLTGVPGKKYVMKVIVNSEVFVATSKMPVAVALDSIYISEVSFIGQTNKWVNVVYKDPPGLGNSYRFVQYVKNVKDKGVFIQNDDLSDGRPVTTTLFGRNTENEINKGDTVKVEMQCIDPAIYKYWFSLSQGATGENESASPANPSTNISGGALGYFSAHTFRTKSIIAK